MSAKRPLPCDLVALLDPATPLPQLRRIPGSGTGQAPLVVDLLLGAGLRASHQSSPPGVAIYLSGHPAADQGGDVRREDSLLRFMCGVAPDQAAFELEFALVVRRPMLLRRLAERFRALRPRAELDAALAPLEVRSSDGIASPLEVADDEESQAEAEAALDALARDTISACAGPMGATALQLTREWQRLLATHSSLANACLARFCAQTGVHLQDATLITSADPKRARISLLLYDSVLHEAQQRPRPFSWVPCLGHLLGGADAHAVARTMCARLWIELRRHRFHPYQAVTRAIEDGLLGWFGSCLTAHGGTLRLRACLGPKQQLCLYLHGAAGSGKSSLVRALLPALAATVRAYLHPELQGAFVKQNLNKTVGSPLPWP